MSFSVEGLEGRDSLSLRNAITASVFVVVVNKRICVCVCGGGDEEGHGAIPFIF